MAIEKNDGLLAKHSLLIEIIRTAWATKLDHKIAAEILERYMSKHSNARVSLRYLEQATGATRSNIIASLARLTAGGAFTVIREGKGTRPTEYGPNFNFSSGIADDTSCGIAGNTSGSGIADGTSSGLAGNTSNRSSGTAGDTQYHLLVPPTGGDKLDKSAPEPGASASRQAPVRTDFEIGNYTIIYAAADIAEDDGSNFIYLAMHEDGDPEIEIDDCIYTQSTNQDAQDSGQAKLAALMRALGVDDIEDVSSLVGRKLQVVRQDQNDWTDPVYIPADEWGKQAMGIAA